jgi:hypothetical protein
MTEPQQPNPFPPKPQAQLIKVGSYPAKIKDWYVKLDKNSSPRFNVIFSITENNEVKNITWAGGIASDKQAAFTADVLALLGMSSNDPSILAEGRAGGALDINKQFEITVRHRKNEQDGKTYHEVEWVNDPSESRFKGAISKAEAKSALSGFASFIVAAREKRGPEIKNYAPTGVSQPPQMDPSEQVPF